MRRDVLILTGAAVVAVGIGMFMFSSGRGDPSNTSSAAVPFTEIAKGSQSSVERRVNYLITSSSQFNELWKVVTATGTPPKIDFKTHSVIAVFCGTEADRRLRDRGREDWGHECANGLYNAREAV